MNDHEILEDENLLVHCADYTDLLQKIAPQDPVRKTIPLKVPYSYGTLWRGTGSLTHNLVPSALREDNIEQLVVYSGMVGANRLTLDREKFQVMHEFSAMKEFIQKANDLGLSLPDERGAMGSQSVISHGVYPKYTGWPKAKVRPVLALAQHYGVSTRLLDWSRSHYVSAYFAASSAFYSLKRRHDQLAKNEKDKDIADLFPPDITENKFAIWTLNAGPILVPSSNHEFLENVHFVGVLKHGNPHIVAQRGCFTLRTSSEKVDDYTKTDRRSLISYAKDECPAMLKYFRVYTAPIIQAPAMLRHLASVGFSKSSIYPGYVGVVEDMKEQSIVSRFEGKYCP